MTAPLTYTVPGMTCDHCVQAVTAEVSAVPGVERVLVDLDTKVVTIDGAPADALVRAAIEEAGYEAAP